MNDRELLELAAKAAGIEYDATASFPKNQSRRFFGLWLKIDGEPYEGQRRRWNPLTSDGDALRLAVELRMEIDHNHPADQQPWVSVRSAPSRMCSVEEFDDKSGRMTATRRAITRAAAEIGARGEKGQP